MAKKQTRRTYSVRAEVHIRVRDAAFRACQTQTQYVEQALRERMDREGVPEVSRDEAVAQILDRQPEPVEPPEFPAHLMWGAQ